jgi:hypothetical protein
MARWDLEQFKNELDEFLKDKRYAHVIHSPSSLVEFFHSLVERGQFCHVYMHTYRFAKLFIALHSCVNYIYIYIYIGT